MLLARLKGSRFGLRIRAFPWGFVLFGLCVCFLRVYLDIASVNSSCTSVVRFLVMLAGHAGPEGTDDWGGVELYSRILV